MKTIYLASGNAHKLHELQTALDQAGLSVQVLGPDKMGGMPEVEETGTTFEANALLKAHALHEIGHSDAWYLADDSGIEIDALDGRPGVISARYAGEPCDDEANNDKVLEEMREVLDRDRSCRFQCVLALVGKDLEETLLEPVKGIYCKSGEEVEALDMIRFFCLIRVHQLLPKFPWMKRQRSVTVHGPLQN